MQYYIWLLMPLIISCHVVLYCIYASVYVAILIYIYTCICMYKWWDSIHYHSVYNKEYTLIYTHDVCMYTKHIPSISFNLFGWLLYNRCCAFPSTVQWMKVFSKYTILSSSAGQGVICFYINQWRIAHFYPFFHNMRMVFYIFIVCWLIVV